MAGCIIRCGQAVAITAAAVLVVCSSGNTATKSGSSLASTDPVPSASDWQPAKLGWGSWQGARTSADGRSLLIALVGGPIYAKSDPCSVAYRASVIESATEVRVRILEQRPLRSATASPACTSEGHLRNLSVGLAAPFESRKLIDSQFDRQVSVFDGSILATPTWIPPGWTEGPETTALTSGPPPPWTRSWTPPRPAPKAGRCTPAQNDLSLAESPGLSATQPPARSYFTVDRPTIHGVTADYSVEHPPGSDDSIARLVWVERGQTLVLSSMPGCAGDTLLPEDTLLHFAEALSLP